MILNVLWDFNCLAFFPIRATCKVRRRFSLFLSCDSGVSSFLDGWVKLNFSSHDCWFPVGTKLTLFAYRQLFEVTDGIPTWQLERVQTKNDVINRKPEPDFLIAISWNVSYFCIHSRVNQDLTDVRGRRSAVWGFWWLCNLKMMSPTNITPFGYHCSSIQSYLPYCLYNRSKIIDDFGRRIIESYQNWPLRNALVQKTTSLFGSLTSDPSFIQLWIDYRASTNI
jgi:hypothetical protein